MLRLFEQKLQALSRGYEIKKSDTRTRGVRGIKKKTFFFLKI